MNELVLAHNDLDGAASAIALTHSLRNHSNLMTLFVDYCDIIPSINKHFRNSSVVSYLDLSLTNETIFKIISDNPHITHIWIDHHKTSSPFAESHKSLFSYIDVTTGGELCSADLTLNYIKTLGLEISEEVNELVKLAHDRDLWKKTDPKSADLNYILKGMGISVFFTHILEDLNRIKKFTDTMLQGLEEGKKNEEMSIELAQANILEWTKNGILYKFTLIKGYASDVGRVLGKDAVVVMLDLNTVRKDSINISFRTMLEEVDVSKFAARFDKGGGHPFSAGGRIPIRILMEGNWVEYVLERL